MPDITHLIRMLYISSNRSSAHLRRCHIGSYIACQNQRVDTGRIPSFPQKRPGSGQDLYIPAFKDTGHSPDTDILFLFESQFTISHFFSVCSSEPAECRKIPGALTSGFFTKCIYGRIRKNNPCSAENSQPPACSFSPQQFKY